MFEIVAANEEASEKLPILAASLVQKISLKSNDLPAEFTEKREFKAMLKAF